MTTPRAPVWFWAKPPEAVGRTQEGAIRNGVAGPLKHALPRVCYYTELGRSTSRGVKTNRGEPKTGEPLAAPLGTEACLTTRNKLPPHVCYLAELCRSSSRGVNRV